MKNYQQITSRHPLPYRHVCALLAAAAGFALAACDSALRSNYAAGDNNAYYQSLIAREVLKETSSATGLTAGAVGGGVHEYARVDDPGPASAPATSTAPSMTQAYQTGLPYAQLNTAEPTFNLSLQDAIARAVNHNLAIKVDAYNPAIKQTAIIYAEAAFDPILFGSSQYSNTDEPFINGNIFGNGVQWQNQIGVKRLLPSGGTAQATINSNFRDVNFAGFTSTQIQNAGNQSYWTSNWNLQLQQPLLRNFGADVTEANIYLAQRDMRISLAQFKQNTIKTIADVEDAYQSLVLAHVNVDILARLVFFSEQTYNDILSRFNIDATTASINQAKSALEAHRADLFRAQITLRNASDRLKADLDDPEIPINSNILIVPTDRPTDQPVHYELADCLDTALRQRPEMQQIRLNLEKLDIQVNVQKNALLPQLDVIGSVQGNGLDRGFDQSVTRTIDPANHIDLVFGLKFEIPLGNRDAEARLASANLQRNQVIENMVQNAHVIVQDVKAQLREVLSDYEEIAIRERVRQAAAAELQGLIDLMNIRPRTPEFMQLILDAQANLSNSEQQLIQAIVNYNLGIMHLEQAKGTLLEFDRISLNHPPAPKQDNVLNKLRILGSTYVTK